MSEYYLSKQGLEMLLHQLTKLEENKNKLIDDHVEEFLIQRSELQNLFDNYIFHLDQLVQTLQAGDYPSSRLPFVTIGSEVEVLDLELGINEKYTIIAPFQNSLANNGASYLSPIGRALLLKKEGANVEVKTPGGLLGFKIKEINFPSNGLDLSQQQVFFDNLSIA